MENSTFNRMISDVTALEDADSKELRQLLDKYPYFQLPYALIAKKFQMEQSPYFDAYLRKAAVHTIDREVLFKFIESQSENSESHMHLSDQTEVVIQETIAEPLQDISHEIKNQKISEIEIPEDNSQLIIEDETTKDAEPDSQITIKKEIETSEIEINENEIHQNVNKDEYEDIAFIDDESVLPNEDIFYDEEEIDAEKENQIPSLKNEAEKNTEVPIFEFNLYEFQLMQEAGDSSLEQLSKEFNSKSNGFISTVEKEIEKETEVIQASKQTIDYTLNLTFSEWIESISSENLIQTVEKAEIHQVKIIHATLKDLIKKDFDEADAVELAQKSILSHDYMVTETYADILARQGKISKAIEMYEKLSLKYPQKSAFFAKKITDLNK